MSQMEFHTACSSGGTDIRRASEDLDEIWFILLLRGQKFFGDKIYSYLKITIAGIDSDSKPPCGKAKNFNPSDFGTVIAAGKGEPTDEVKAEIATMYPCSLTKS